MTADTSETGFEALIVRSLIDEGGYVAGDSRDYDRDHAIDVAKLFACLNATQLGSSRRSTPAPTNRNVSSSSIACATR